MNKEHAKKMKLKDKEHQKEQSVSAKIHGKEVVALTKNLKVSTLHVLCLLFPCV